MKLKELFMNNKLAGDFLCQYLLGIFVYKFKINKQKILLAYRLQPDKFVPQEIALLSLGSHENFYSEMKR